MKTTFTLGDTLDIIEKLVKGEALPVEIEELAEAVLQGGLRAEHARTILIFGKHPDKVSAWERFVVSSKRIYGVSWRTTLVLTGPATVYKMDQNRVLACSMKGCMELAWGRVCDQCLTRQWGRVPLV